MYKHGEYVINVFTDAWVKYLVNMWFGTWAKTDNDKLQTNSTADASVNKKIE